LKFRGRETPKCGPSFEVFCFDWQTIRPVLNFAGRQTSIVAFPGASSRQTANDGRFPERQTEKWRKADFPAKACGPSNGGGRTAIRKSAGKSWRAAYFPSCRMSLEITELQESIDDTHFGFPPVRKKSSPPEIKSAYRK